MDRRKFIQTNTIALGSALLYPKLNSYLVRDINQDLAEGFVTTFRQASDCPPFTLWQWINGCVTKEGITYDLEAFRKAGIKDVQQFLIGGSEADVTDPDITILGDKWMGLMRFALDECRRLGMTFGTHNCPGWSASGAPGIQPEDSMQKLVWTKTTVSGKNSDVVMIKPFEPDAQWKYYKDICIVAIPSGVETIAKKNVLVYIDYLTPQHGLKQKLPEGDWVILRFGHTTTGHKNETAPITGKGLEVDKLSKTAVDKFWELYPAKLIEMAGDYAGTTFKRIESDSYEAHAQTWTPKLAEEFKQRCGYDLLPWLAALTGYTVENQEFTARFKQDWQQTLNSLFAENYYGHLNDLIHQKQGLEFLIQPYSTGSTNFNFSAVRGIGDIPMCEFWWGDTTWGWDSILPVASNSHVNGKKLIAAEAFTGQPQFAWKVDLFDLKAAGDKAFCNGVNLFVLHASAHQPWPNVTPGMTMGWWGTQFGPSQTWWTHGAPEWIQYISRCQMVLQKGLFVSDICFLHLSKQKDPSIPTGFKADICNDKEFIERFDIKGKEWVLPDGMCYKIVILPPNCSIEVKLAKRIEQLIKKGGVVLGNGFKGTSGQKELEFGDDEVKKISESLFGLPSPNGNFTKHIRTIGKGKVYIGYQPSEVLSLENITKDVETLEETKDILWTHRMDSNEHYYFVSNRSNKAKKINISFRVSGLLPELWNPETGIAVDAPIWSAINGKTEVRLNFEGFGSVFVVFRKPTVAKNIIEKCIINETPNSLFEFLTVREGKWAIRLKEAGNYRLKFANGTEQKIQGGKVVLQVLNNDWDVSFQQKRGAPPKIKMHELISYTKHQENGVKYFSGKAVYRKTIKLNAEDISSSKGIFLDLGEVKNIATILINGNKVRTFWKPPFTCEITQWCKIGENRLAIEVTNLWPNRMIGDEFEPDDLQWGKDRYFTYVNPTPKIGRNLQEVPEWVKNKTERPSKNRITFTTMDFFDKEDALLPSGLLGPVRLSIENIWQIPK